MVHALILVLLACDSGDRTLAPSCADYCETWKDCRAAIPGNRWDECDGWCNDARVGDDFAACMDTALPESGVDAYGADYDGCTYLYETCSSGVLSNQ